jgi:glycosyltransferase involved in cell wall biosynthesis
MTVKGFEEIKNDRMVKWTVGKYDVDQISEWYNNLSCYIFPSSGEGWSFTPRESTYLGVPTIVSDIPVHKELIESGFCKKIEASGKERAIFGGNVFGEWSRVDEYDIFHSILDVYNNYEQWSVLAPQGGRWIEDKWRNEDMQAKLFNFIHSL